MDILFNALECIRCPLTERIRSNRNIKISMHTLDQLKYRFAAHQSNVAAAQASSILIGSLKATNHEAQKQWHERYLDGALRLGQILFVGIVKCNDECELVFPRFFFQFKFYFLIFFFNLRLTLTKVQTLALFKTDVFDAFWVNGPKLLFTIDENEL